MIIDNNSTTNENYSKSNNGYDYINDSIDEYEK